MSAPPSMAQTYHQGPLAPSLNPKAARWLPKCRVAGDAGVDSFGECCVRGSKLQSMWFGLGLMCVVGFFDTFVALARRPNKLENLARRPNLSNLARHSKVGQPSSLEPWFEVLACSTPSSPVSLGPHKLDAVVNGQKHQL